MAVRDIGFLAVLLSLAAYVWLRDPEGIAPLENTLPILVSLPLFVFLGSPWRMRRDPPPLSYGSLVMGMAGFVTGLLLDMAIWLAACWTFLLWTWIRSRIEEQDLPSVRRLMILPFLAFPWLYQEGNVIGWYFRLSGSWATAGIFSAMGFTVLHDGTRIMVQGMPVGIGEACSGINVLQSMLIAGSALTYLYLGKHRTYWWNILGLVLVAWVANTLRIVILCIAALTLGHEFAMGLFHTWGGWILLCIMMCFSWGILSIQAVLPRRPVP
ncbi:MAG TPA: archaeosortase/exosortase family protein [Deltaproteobacteria bacterium]|nr:archaeosortase/exosortase family protein [Deltaproteobacteria bacterium]HQI80656.1 archaeosortase/exosortase family protein [Deltaproteobacteria bacterium]